jgi:ribA/ribD-fused uncharacterized protein
MNGPITAFTGEHRFLSNFYESPITWGSTTTPTLEHAFQCAKTFDPVAQAKILESPSPAVAKRYGRAVPLRSDWEEVKIPTMRYLLFMKFTAGGPLASQLIATGDTYLVEGNHWGDTFWGVCNGNGSNWLGHLLMARRAELRAAMPQNTDALDDAFQRGVDAGREGWTPMT